MKAMRQLAAAVIYPGMVRTLLDERVARLHSDLGVVQKHVYLAFENDRVVNTSGPMGIGVSHVPLRCRINAHGCQDFVVIDVALGSPSRAGNRLSER